MRDVDTVVVDSLKALDPNRPIREAIKGHPKFGGRPRGQANRNTRLLKDAILLAGSVTAERFVMREIIELSKAEALDKDGERMAGELEECVEEHGPLVGYLSWLAEHHPVAYASMLGKVLPLQIRVDSHKDIQYRTLADVQRDIDALSEPLRRIAPKLISMTMANTNPPRASEDNNNGRVLDDAEDEDRS